MKRGFTLIELLVVIAILAVLSAGLFIVIDPLDKMRSANDAKAMNDIGQIANAMEAYAVAHSSTYVTTLTALIDAGELKTQPVAPTGYTYTITASTTAPTVTTNLLSKKYTTATPTAPFFVWCAASGKIGTSATTGVCP